MFECFNCMTRSVLWGADYDFEEYGLEGDGVVHVLHCQNCKAEIVYYCAAQKAADKEER